MSAKNAVLTKTGSHWVSDDNSSSRIDGISKEEVYFYFTAEWRGQPVQVEVSADKYAHSSGMSDWRVYARSARFYDPEKNGGRGQDTTDTARRALSLLCSPIAQEWLRSEEYKASFEQSLAHMVMRKFQDSYRTSRGVSEALDTFKTRLAPAAYKAIAKTLKAYDAYESAKDQAFQAIKGDS